MLKQVMVVTVVATEVPVLTVKINILKYHLEQ